MIVPHGDQQLGSTAAGGLASFGASVVGDDMATITIPMDLDVATGKEHESWRAEVSRLYLESSFTAIVLLHAGHCRYPYPRCCCANSAR